MSRLCASKSQTVQYAEVLPTDTVVIPGEEGVLHAVVTPMPKQMFSKSISSSEELEPTSGEDENVSDTTSDSPGVTNTGRFGALGTDSESAPEEPEVSATNSGKAGVYSDSQSSTPKYEMDIYRTPDSSQEASPDFRSFRPTLAFSGDNLSNSFLTNLFPNMLHRDNVVHSSQDQPLNIREEILSKKSRHEEPLLEGLITNNDPDNPSLEVLKGKLQPELDTISKTNPSVIEDFVKRISQENNLRKFIGDNFIDTLSKYLQKTQNDTARKNCIAILQSPSSSKLRLLVSGLEINSRKSEVQDQIVDTILQSTQKDNTRKLDHPQAKFWHLYNDADAHTTETQFYHPSPVDHPQKKMFRENLANRLDQIAEKNKNSADFMYCAKHQKQRPLSFHNGQVKLMQTHFSFLYNNVFKTLEKKYKETYDKLPDTKEDFDNFTQNLLILYVGAANTKKPSMQTWRQVTDEKYYIKNIPDDTAQKLQFELNENAQITFLCRAEIPFSDIDPSATATRSLIRPYNNTVTYKLEGESTKKTWLRVLAKEWDFADAADKILSTKLNEWFRKKYPCLEERKLSIESVKKFKGISLTNRTMVEVNGMFFAPHCTSDNRYLADLLSLVKHCEILLIDPQAIDEVDLRRNLCMEADDKRLQIRQELFTTEMACEIAEESRMYGRYWRIDTKADSENLPDNVDKTQLRYQIDQKSKNGRVNFSAAQLEKLKCKNLKQENRILVDGKFWQPLQIHVVFITDSRKDNEMLDLTTSKATTAALYHQVQAKNQAQIKKSVLSWAIWDCLSKAEETNHSYSMNFLWALIFSGFFYGAQKSECFAHFKTSMIDLASILRRLPLIFDKNETGVEFVRDWILQCLDVSSIGYAQAEPLGARPHCMEHRQIIDYGLDLPLVRKTDFLRGETKDRIAHCLVTVNIFIDPLTMRVANDEIEFTKFSTGKPPKDMYDATACFKFLKKNDDTGSHILMQPIAGKPIPGKIQNEHQNFYIKTFNAYYVTSFYRYTFENLRHSTFIDTQNVMKMSPEQVYKRDCALKQTKHELLLPEASQENSKVLKELRVVVLDNTADQMSRYCLSSPFLSRPLLKLKSNGIHANVWIDLVLKKVIGCNESLNFDMKTIWEFSKYDFSKSFITQKLDARVAIKEAIQGFKLQQKSSITYRDKLCGPFWLLGYILDENIDNLKSTLKFFEITGQTFEFDGLKFSEEDLIALAAILQTVKYTWIQFKSSDKFVQDLETKVFETRANLLRFMMKANQIPKNYADFITDSDYNFSMRNFKKQIQSILSIRFYNLLSLCSHADTEDKKSFALHHSFVFKTDDKGKCKIFDQHEISQWPKSDSKRFKRAYTLLMQIIVNDVGSLIDLILETNHVLEFWSEVIKYTSAFGAVACAEAIMNQKQNIDLNVEQNIIYGRKKIHQIILKQNQDSKQDTTEQAEPESNIYFSSLVFGKSFKPFEYESTQRNYEDTLSVLQGKGRVENQEIPADQNTLQDNMQGQNMDDKIDPDIREDDQAEKKIEKKEYHVGTQKNKPAANPKINNMFRNLSPETSAAKI